MIITLKNNKGGVGKSWLTLQLAHGTQIATEEKVLILTSDSQNNIKDFAGINIEINEATGLETWIKKGDGDLIRLRDNLYFIPIAGTHLRGDIKNNFLKLITELKKEYSYIFIDSTPVMKLDDIFIEQSDGIIIPTFLDGITTTSIENFIKSVSLNKIKAIIPNRFNNTKKEKFYYEGLKNILADENIELISPIPQSAILGDLIDKGKTIWESENKKLEDIKNSLIKVIREIL